MSRTHRVTRVWHAEALPFGCLADDSPCSEVVGLGPGVAERGDLDDVAGLWGLDVVVVSDVDPDVVEVGEEDEVARLELILRHVDAVVPLAAAKCGSEMPTWANTYMTRPEQSKVFGPAVPHT